MATNDPLGVPEIEDKRTKPAGLLPKNAQAWAVAILALVMVLIIWLSNGAGQKQRPKEPTPPFTSDPNPTRIDQVRQRIDELANKNRTEQERIAALQGAIASQGGLTPAEVRYPIAAPAPLYGGRGPLDANPQGGWLDPEEQKRLSRAPYSSNLALSYRKEDQASTEQVSAGDLKAFAANLTDGGNRLPSSGSGTPQRTAQRPDANQDEEERKGSDRQRKAPPAHPHRPGEIDYPLSEGTVLETVLTNRLDGYFSGPVNCMLTTDVYSPNGVHVLIPSGTRVLGEVRRVDTFGQQRLAVVFHRLIMPDGYSVLLDQLRA